MNPICDKCGDEIQFNGALVFSPPENKTVSKYHICLACWVDLLTWLTVKGTP
jgi:hypothetical protein